MTLGKLIKELQKLQKVHGSRIRVAANTQALLDSVNCVWQVVEIGEVDCECIEMVDGDGSTKYRKNGEQVYANLIILK